MPLTMDGPRTLLRRLRQVMAEDSDRQKRLDKIVELIAVSMDAAVCSVYLRRGKDALELCATEGLNPEAVHRTVLRFGEGLVGDIAQHKRPLNLSDAPSHPRFAYRPETGEDPFKSFVGVPVLRSGMWSACWLCKTARRAVLSLRKSKHCKPAMVLAEMLVADEELAGNRAGPHRFEGIGLTRLAMGQRAA